MQSRRERPPLSGLAAPCRKSTYALLPLSSPDLKPAAHATLYLVSSRRLKPGRQFNDAHPRDMHRKAKTFRKEKIRGCSLRISLGNVTLFRGQSERPGVFVPLLRLIRGVLVQLNSKVSTGLK